MYIYTKEYFHVPRNTERPGLHANWLINNGTAAEWMVCSTQKDVPCVSCHFEHFSEQIKPTLSEQLKRTILLSSCSY